MYMFVQTVVIKYIFCIVIDQYIYSSIYKLTKLQFKYRLKLSIKCFLIYIEIVMSYKNLFLEKLSLLTGTP